LFTFLKASHSLHFRSYISSKSSLSLARYNSFPNSTTFSRASFFYLSTASFSFMMGASSVFLLAFYYFKAPKLLRSSSFLRRISLRRSSSRLVCTEMEELRWNGDVLTLFWMDSGLRMVEFRRSRSSWASLR
jgi:hypothetical protein